MRLRVDRDRSDAESADRRARGDGVAEILERRMRWPGRQRGRYLRERIEVEYVFVVAEVPRVHVGGVSPSNSGGERPSEAVDVGYDGVHPGQTGAATDPRLLEEKRLAVSSVGDAVVVAVGSAMSAEQRADGGKVEFGSRRRGRARRRMRARDVGGKLEESIIVRTGGNARRC